MVQHVGRFAFQSERNTQPLSLCVGRVLPAQAGWLQSAALVGHANARDDSVNKLAEKCAKQSVRSNLCANVMSSKKRKQV